jgi:hypothetical protein
VAIAIALTGVANASAATRYAEPGGNGAEPCLQADPCSFFQAADATSGAALFDKVILAPGTYSDKAGDLGPSDTVSLKAFITVEGETGQPRPLILAEEATETPLTLNPSNVVSRIEIDNRSAKYGVYVKFGLLAESIVRSSPGASGTGPDLYACKLGFTPSAIADTVCIATGKYAAAVGAQHTLTSANTTELRNVTAIAGAEHGVALHVFASGPFAYTVRAKSVIAGGAEMDVLAYGRGNPPATPATGATLKIELDHSNFKDTQVFNDATAGATTTITGPEEAGNQAEPEPLFAADGYHQLPTSPTVDAGETYAAISATDLDGQQRVIGPKPDIGADELLHQTSTTVACAPESVELAGTPATTTCRATVADLGNGAHSPSGVVSFEASGGGTLGSGQCALISGGPGLPSTCEVTYTPTELGGGSHTISASYAGDSLHTASSGATSVAVIPKATVVCLCPGGGPDYKVKILRKPPRKSAKRRVKIAFVSEPAGARFECKLDKGPFKACTSPFKRKVAEGSHVFKVRAVGTGAKTKPKEVRWQSGSFNGPSSVR